MDKVEQEIMRAEEAQRLLNSPMFERAFSDTRTALLETWAALDKSDSEHSKDLHRMVKCLDKVKRCLEYHISTGKLAQKQIESREKSRLFSFRRA